MPFQIVVTERLTLFSLILCQYVYETDKLVSIVNMTLQSFVHSILVCILDMLEVSELFRLIMSGVVLIESNNLIFVIDIHLVSNYGLMLYKSISFEIEKDKYFIMIKLKTDFILSKNRLYYVLFNINQLDKCKPIKNKLLCHHNQLIYHQHMSKSCEIMLFNKKNVLPDSRNAKVVNVTHGF